MNPWLAGVLLLLSCWLALDSQIEDDHPITGLWLSLSLLAGMTLIIVGAWILCVT